MSYIIIVLISKSVFTIYLKNSSTAWWTRERLGEYFPVFTKDSSTLLEYMRNMNILLQYADKESKPVLPIFKIILDKLRSIISRVEGSFLIWTIFLTVMVAAVTRR